MTDSSDQNNFHVPKFIRRAFQGILSPGQKLEEIFDQIGGLILDESDEIRPDETVWGSQTMTLNNKKLKTLDMFFKKVVKTETDDVDSNCSINSNDGSVIEESSKTIRCKSSPDSIPQISSPEKVINKILKTDKNMAVTPTNKLKPKINRSKSRQHSVSSSDDESLRKNASSPTYSVDIFAEETQRNSDNPNKANSEHSLSDTEIIPSSQVHQSSSRLSLGNLSSNESSIKSSQNSNAGIKYSGSAKDPISKQNLSKKSDTQNISLEKEISSSEEDVDNDHPALSKLDSIKNNMKNIKEVFSEIKSSTEKFSFEDLTEDDELYILQCPSEIDSKKLEGVELTLEGNSVVSVDEESKYDCFSFKENSKRYLYVALPDSNEQEMKLGVFRLAGNIILSENLGIPYTKPIEDDALGDVTLELCNTSLSEEHPSQHIPKKKKKLRKSDGSDIESRFAEFENSKIECEDTQIIPDTEDHETPLNTKKKKKRSMEGKDLNCSISDFNKVQFVKNDWQDSQIISGTEDQETSFKVKKKKKRSKEDTTQDEATESEFFSENVSDVLNKLATKKKKRKHHRVESNEVTDYESDFDKFLNIKTELEEPQVVSDFQETPSKSKKRSRKDMEDSEEFSKEEVPKKKKKKKHSYSESQQDML